MTNPQLETGDQQDKVHKEVMHAIKQLQDGLDITGGTDVFTNPEWQKGPGDSKVPRQGRGERASLHTQSAD